MELEYWRPKRYEYFLAMASLVSLRATCRRRRVGCILVDSNRHVLATGYNGVARGADHCLDHPCAGAGYESGTGLEKCEAIHAEQNALLQCKDTSKIETAYITVSPCMTCVKLLMNTGCKRIVFLEEYVNLDAKNLWKGEWIYHGPIEHVYAEIGLVSAKRVSESGWRKNHIIRLRDKGSVPSGTGSGGSEI